ncbi:trypsin-2-like [Drosophila nasuta]|uniref:trypsin-2-like n=1 Tax=Drosophila nasuta TaxID=42062 RepID=UPI00295E2DD0|nr:trypsin-2-like [Drosophila nasuta]
MHFFKLIYFLLILLCLAQSVELTVRSDRMKRIATPNFDEEFYRTLAKYVVSIRSRTPHKYFGDNHFCGGTIISPIFVITAGHCVMDKRKIMHRSRVILVVAGTPNRLKHILGATLNMPAEKIFVHTNFTLYNTNNIALIKLAESLPSNNKHVGFIKLPSKPPNEGSLFRVMGWGRVYEGGALASRILYVDVKLRNRSFCESFINYFSAEMLCAGNFVESDEDPCPGDSGDPFLQDLTLYGVVTYGLGCGNTHMPSVYSNVWYHMDWINEILTENSGRKIMEQSLLLRLNLLIIFIMNCFYFNFYKFI